ncbi:baseplate assembly protein [Bacillus solitudinis]|uniref:baseplate assembly protein n=1 Tax=Bacillus solitudinis TaxID=2014074 RepID=UPI000C23B8D7|nr:baseplate J/gp47 family protein [Bacillus solitudinis]
MTLKLSDLPEVSFVEKDINQILNDMIRGYEQAYFEQTGVRKILRPGDPIRIFLYSQALRELQLRVIIDDSAKQNLLKYSRGDFLEGLGAFSRTNRFDATASRVRTKFNLSEARPVDETIPQGTRVSPGGDIYFAVMEDTVVPAGQMSVEFLTECLQVGVVGNGFTPGQINILVDPLPWIATVENTEESLGGIDREGDDSFRDRIHLAPEGFSVAGPTGAYEYFTREYSPLVEDVLITSPSAGVVDIRLLLKDGDLPTQTFLEGINVYLSDKERRPLTDNVLVNAPITVSYNLDVTYYIRSDDSLTETELKAQIEAAIDEYITWQRSKIGRDVNPSELMARIILAGAKRADVVSPIFATIAENEVAVIGTKTVIYGGLE